MKKFLAVMAMLAVFAAGASAEVVGTLREGNTNSDVAVHVKHELLAQVFDAGLSASKPSMKFYDSLTLMLLALEKGEIAAIAAPELVGEYMLRQNRQYILRGFLISEKLIASALGFRDDKKELCAKFSKAIREMTAEGMIGILARDYLTGPSAQNPPAVKFEDFDGAETITVAVTGDMPPLDYTGADGEPAGFNTAILAEIARRIHVNIRTVTVETATRVPALLSGRVDAVFWFEVFEGYEVQPDVPDEVITSTPYYGWNKIMLIGKK